MKLSRFTIKKFLVLSQKKALLIFQEKSLKKIFKFQETELSYISGSNFPSPKSKNNPLLKSFLYFVKWNFLAKS